MISRTRARRAFDEYVSAYDPANPRIALKIEHTLRVAELCARIAASEGFGADIAWLCGLLHDIGRFEQVRRFDTFNDGISVSHAALGADVLFRDAGQHAAPGAGDPSGRARPHGQLIRAFVDAREGLDDLLKTAVATHSAYRLPADLDEVTRTYCDILRDADKIDIIQVNCICPIEDIYGVTERDMYESRLSPSVIEGFFDHHTLPRHIRHYPADILVGHICFAWELVYPESLRILKEQGHLEDMLSRRFARADTQRAFEQMADHMRSRLPVAAHSHECTHPKSAGRRPE